MKVDTVQTLKGISKNNMLLGLIFTILIAISLGINGALAFFIGNVIATLNLIINGVVISFVLNKGKYSFLIGLSFFIRILIVSLFVIIFRNNILGLVLYLVALIVHQLSIIFYKPALT